MGRHLVHADGGPGETRRQSLVELAQVRVAAGPRALVERADLQQVELAARRTRTRRRPRWACPRRRGSAGSASAAPSRRRRAARSRPGRSTSSVPLVRCWTTPPVGTETCRQGAVAAARRRTEPSRVSTRSVSAAWPSTAPSAPSFTAIERTLRSPVSRSCVTITPGLLRRDRAQEEHRRVDVLRVRSCCPRRQAKERGEKGEAQTSPSAFITFSKPTTFGSVRLMPAPVKPGRSSTFVSERTKTPPWKPAPNSRSMASRRRRRKSGPGSVVRTMS